MAIGLTLGLSLAGNTALSSAAPIVLDQSAFFPASTAANTGGFKPFDTNGNEVDLVSVDDQTGTTRTWSIASGRLVANGTPDVDNGDTITVTDAYDNSIVLTIDSATAGECYVSWSEFDTLMGTDLSGRTLFGRPGSYTVVGGNGYFNGDFNDLSSPVTFDACASEYESQRPSFDRFAIFSSTAPTTDIGNVVIQNMKFYREVTTGDKLTTDSSGISGLIQIEDGGGGIPDNININNNIFKSNYPIARLTGTRPTTTIYGVWCKEGSNINVDDNECSYMHSLVQLTNCATGTIHRNNIHHCWDDPFKIVDTCSNIDIYDNEFSNCIGDHGLHPDFLHFFQETTGHQISNVRLRGYVAYPGTEGHICPPWPSKQLGGGAFNREASYQTANRTIGTGDADAFIICDDTLTLTLDDPTLAGGEEEIAIQLRAVGGTTSNVITIDRDGYNFIDSNNGDAAITTDVLMIEPWETVLLRIQPAQSRWALIRVAAYYQAVFTNANTNGYTGIELTDLILWPQASANGVRFDGTSSDDVTVNRVQMAQAWPGALNGVSGRENSHANGGPVQAGRFDFDGTNGTVNNSMGDSVIGTFVDGGNNALTSDIDMSNWADMVANFNVADALTEVHYPTTKLEAIAMMRPKAGSFRDVNGIGSLGAALDGSNDTYNFGQIEGEPIGPRAALSNQSATQTGTTTADWSVDANTAGGTIYAAARLASDAALSKTNIQNGTGDAVATSTDASVVAGSGNGGSFTGLTADTEYVVDMYHVDGDTNESGVRSTAAFTTDSAVADIAPVVLGTYADNGVKESPKTLTTTVAASGNHPVLVLVPNRANTGTSQTVTVTLDSNPMTLINSAFIAQLNLHSFWIPSTSVPAGTFDIEATNTALFNGMDIVGLEMVNAKDDQTGAVIGTAIQQASSSSESPSVTTGTNGSLVVAHTCTVEDHTSITGEDTVVDDGSVNIGNSVTYSGVAYKQQATAGAASITFNVSAANLFVAHAFEVLKA